MSPFDPADQFSTPFGAPLVPPLPIRLRRTEILTVAYRTAAASADALIPLPLRASGDLVLVHVYRMHDAEWFGVYCESAWQLPVVLPDGRSGVYSPFLVLQSDSAVAAGREAYGQPKKAGHVSLAPDGDLLVGRVARNGIELATLTMCWKQTRVSGALLEELAPGGSLNVNLRIVPQSGARYRRELVARRLGELVEHEAWTGPATIELRPSAQVPVYLLPVREVVLGLHRVVDLSLEPGDVVHDYGSA